jgi:hypothetical protein
MALREVPLGITEEALALLRFTYWEAAKSADTKSYGRIRSRTNSIADPVPFSKELAYLRIVSIVEAFVDAVASELFSTYRIGQSETLRKIVASVETKSASNWAERRESFKKYHGVTLTNANRSRQVQTCIMVRNAVAHRLGRLSDSRRSLDLVAELKTINVEVSGESVVVDLPALQTCLNVATEYVESIDEMVRNARRSSTF